MNIYDDIFYKFYNNEFSIKFAQSDKAFFIYNLKIASRYLEDVAKFPSLHFNLSGDDLKIINCNYNNNNPNDVGRISDDYINTIKSDWENLKISNTKKDIVILYRNPISRLATAILQDSYSFITARDSHIYLFPILSKLDYSEKEIEDFLANVGVDNIMNESPYKLELFERMVISIIDVYADGFIRYSETESSHFNSHLLPLVKLLTTTKIDKNKIIMIDLDSDKESLENYLKKVSLFNPSPDSYSKYHNRTTRLDHIFRLISTPDISKKVMEKIKGELYAYNILKYFNKELIK